MTDHDPTTAEPQLPIFTYGTLRSGESAEELIVRDVARRVPGRARGRLLPLNASYPAAVFPPEAS